jgi:hypothetical protein
MGRGVAEDVDRGRPLRDPGRQAGSRQGHDVCNHDIRALAKDDLPMLKEHLKLAQAALAAAGGSTAG